MPTLSKCACKSCTCTGKPVAKSKSKSRPKPIGSRKKAKVVKRKFSMKVAKANGYECDKGGYWDPNVVSWTYGNKPTKGGGVSFKGF